MPVRHRAQHIHVAARAGLAMHGFHDLLHGARVFCSPSVQKVNTSVSRPGALKEKLRVLVVSSFLMFAGSAARTRRCACGVSAGYASDYHHFARVVPLDSSLSALRGPVALCHLMSPPWMSTPISQKHKTRPEERVAVRRIKRC